MSLSGYRFPSGLVVARGEHVGASQDSLEPEPEDTFVKKCRLKGRWINIAITFGVDLQDIFKLGVRMDEQNLGIDNDNDNDDDVNNSNGNNDNLTVETKELLLDAYRAILNLVPSLKEMLPYRDGVDTEYFYKVVEAMHDGCGTARSEAIRRIKDNTINYLTAGPTPVKVDMQIQHKELRGIHDRNTGRLIIPICDLEEWDIDPDAARARYLSGLFPICAIEMPVFLYEDYKYTNPENPEEGLFRGAFLVCVLVDILFGTSAVDLKNAKRQEHNQHTSVGESNHLTAITPKMIAYAAVIACFCLSSQRKWNLQDGAFNYRTFYQEIILLLADPEDPWVQETIAWWNERVFGNEHGKLLIEDPNEQRRKKREQFDLRRAARKAASRTTEARSTIIPVDTETVSPQGLTEDTPLSSHDDVVHSSPSTPPPWPNTTIDPTLLDTPDMDRSMLTLPLPQVPQTPNTTGPSPRQLSPLSNISDAGPTVEGVREIQTRKRKSQASNASRPRGKATKKSRA